MEKSRTLIAFSIPYLRPRFQDFTTIQQGPKELSKHGRGCCCQPEIGWKPANLQQVSPQVPVLDRTFNPGRSTVWPGLAGITGPRNMVLRQHRFIFLHRAARGHDPAIGR